MSVEVEHQESERIEDQKTQPLQKELPRGLMRIKIGEKEGVMPISKVSEPSEDEHDQDPNKMLTPRLKVKFVPVRGLESHQTKLYRTRADEDDDADVVIGYSRDLDIPKENEEAERQRREQLRRIHEANVSYVPKGLTSQAKRIKELYGITGNDELTVERLKEEVSKGTMTQGELDDLLKHLPLHNTLIITTRFQPEDKEYTNTSYYEIDGDKLPYMQSEGEKVAELIRLTRWDSESRRAGNKSLELDKAQKRKLKELQEEPEVAEKVKRYYEERSEREREEEIQEQLQEESRRKDEFADVPTQKLAPSLDDRIQMLEDQIARREESRQYYLDQLNNGSIEDPEKEDDRKRRIDRKDEILKEQRKQLTLLKAQRDGVLLPEKEIQDTQPLPIIPSDKVTRKLEEQPEETRALTTQPLPELHEAPNSADEPRMNAPRSRRESEDDEQDQTPRAKETRLEKHNRLIDEWVQQNPEPNGEDQREKAKYDARKKQYADKVGGMLDLEYGPPSYRKPEEPHPPAETPTENTNTQTIKKKKPGRFARIMVGLGLGTTLLAGGAKIREEMTTPTPEQPPSKPGVADARERAVNESTPRVNAAGTGDRNKGDEVLVVLPDELGQYGIWGEGDKQLAHFFHEPDIASLRANLEKHGLNPDMLLGLENTYMRIQEQLNPEWQKTDEVIPLSQEQMDRLMDLVNHRTSFASGPVSHKATRELIALGLKNAWEGLDTDHDKNLADYIKTGNLSNGGSHGHRPSPSFPRAR